MPDDEGAQRMDIFALKKELEAATSHEQIMALMKRELGNFGVHEWIYLFQIAEFFQRPSVLCMNTLRPDWLAHYLSSGYFTVDPLFRHFRS